MKINQKILIVLLKKKMKGIGKLYLQEEYSQEDEKITSDFRFTPDEELLEIVLILAKLLKGLDFKKSHLSDAK